MVAPKVAPNIVRGLSRAGLADVYETPKSSKVAPEMHQKARFFRFPSVPLRPKLLIFNAFRE